MSVRRKVDVYSWARANRRDRSVAQDATIEERQERQEHQERQRLRLTLETIRQRVTTGGRLAVEAIDDLEVHPARHRRNVIWQY